MNVERNQKSVHETFCQVMSEDTELLQLLGNEPHIYFYFPPEDVLGIFPRINFYFMALREEDMGDDESVLFGGRIVLDIYNTAPPVDFPEVILKSLRTVENVKFTMVNSYDRYDPSDKIYGKHLEIEFQII